MDYQERDESSCLTLTEAFSLVSLSCLCGASLIISIPAIVAGIQKYYVKQLDLRQKPERLIVYLACGSCITAVLWCSQWICYFAAHSSTAELVCSVLDHTWLMVITFYSMFSLSAGIHFIIQKLKWKQSTCISSIPLHTQPVLSRASEITCVCISLVLAFAVVPSAKAIVSSHLWICWIDIVTDNCKTVFEEGDMNVMVPNIAILGISSLSFISILMLLRCVCHEKHLSVNLYGLSFLIVSIVLTIVITFLSPYGCKLMKVMLLSFIPVKSSSVSLASLHLSNHNSCIPQERSSEKQNSSLKDEDIHLPMKIAHSTMFSQTELTY